MYWESEETVSIHCDAEIKAKEKCVGGFCEVSFGKRQYTGKIACIGKNSLLSWVYKVHKLSTLGSKAEMIAREKAYLKGVYTPFQPGKFFSVLAAFMFITNNADPEIPNLPPQGNCHVCIYNDRLSIQLFKLETAKADQSRKKTRRKRKLVGNGM